MLQDTLSGTDYMYVILSKCIHTVIIKRESFGMYNSYLVTETSLVSLCHTFQFASQTPPYSSLGSQQVEP